METQKNCQTCRYFTQHYSKQRTRISYVNCGTCQQGKFKNQKRLIVDCCECWEDNAALKKERRQSVNKSLIEVSKRLDELIFILKDD